MTTFSIVFEELSRGWMGVAGILGSHSMACFVIAKHGTPEQKASQLVVLHHYFEWLKSNGGDASKISIDGHYHYSTDKNRNGIIDKWERIKECPSYDAKEEFRWLLIRKGNNANQLPTKI
jgi:hypothetical protein